MAYGSDEVRLMLVTLPTVPYLYNYCAQLDVVAQCST